MEVLSLKEIDAVSGGNAQDTVTGSFVSNSPAPEPGLGVVPGFGFGGIAIRIIIRVIAAL